MKKRLLCILLSLILVVLIIPLSVLANESTTIEPVAADEAVTMQEDAEQEVAKTAEIKNDLDNTWTQKRYQRLLKSESRVTENGTVVESRVVDSTGDENTGSQIIMPPLLEGNLTLAAQDAMKDEQNQRMSSDTDTKPIREVREDDYVFSEYKDHSWAISSYEGPGGDLVYPTTVEGKGVYVARYSVFDKCDKNTITGITVPEGFSVVGTINELNNLKKLQMPSTVVYMGGLSGLGLETLGGLALAKQIISLSVSDFYALTDISGLEGLSLKWLRISACDKLQNIEAIGSLSDLDTLYLFDNSNLSELSGMEGAVNMKQIDIRGSAIKSLKPLEEMEKLKRLYVTNASELSDLSPLKNKPVLHTLQIENTKVSDLSPLKSNKELKDLALRQCQVKDIGVLKELSNLVWLDLSGNAGIKDISVLKGLGKLTTLTLDPNVELSDADMLEILRFKDSYEITVGNSNNLDISPQISFRAENTATRSFDFIIEVENTDIAQITKNYSNYTIVGLKDGTTKGIVKAGEAQREFSIKVGTGEISPPVGEKVENLPVLQTHYEPARTQEMALYPNGELWCITEESPRKIMSDVKNYVGNISYVSNSQMSWLMIQDNSGSLWTEETKGFVEPVLSKRVDHVSKYVAVGVYGQSIATNGMSGSISHGFAIDENHDLWRLGGNSTNKIVQRNVKDMMVMDQGLGIAIVKNDQSLWLQYDRLDPQTPALDFTQAATGVTALLENGCFEKDGQIWKLEYNYDGTTNTYKPMTKSFGKDVKRVITQPGFRRPVILIKNNETWIQPFDEEPELVFNGECSEVKGPYGNNLHLLDTQKNLWVAEKVYDYNLKNSRWEVQKVAENILSFNGSGNYLDQNHRLMKIQKQWTTEDYRYESQVLAEDVTDYITNYQINYYLKSNNVVYKDDTPILDQVVRIDSNDTTSSAYQSGVYMTRTDGSVWVSRSHGDPTTYKLSDYQNYIAVTGVSVNPKELTLAEGFSGHIETVVEPSNATNQTLTYKSSHEKVASVNENGKIKGVKAGEAVITVITEDGNKTAECKVTVKKAVPVLDPDSGTAVGIVSGETGQNFVDKLKENGIIGSKDQIKLLNTNGQEVSLDEPLATGMKVVVTTGQKMFNRNAGTRKYTVIVLGDISGDGIINILDMLAAQDDILGKEKLEGCYRTAADITGDNAVNILDMLAIQDDILGKEKINPYL